MKIDFEFHHPVHGKYADALYFPDNHMLSDAEIEAMKQQRFDNWVAVVSTPAAEGASVEVDGEVYHKLEGVPPSGATLKEVDGIWYYKV
jgi:hypothetical protein